MNISELIDNVVDILDDTIYISDIDTYEMYYMNQSLQNKLGNPKKEEWYTKPCYKVLYNKRKPCDFCVNHLVKEKELYKWRYYNNLTSQWLEMQDTKMQYNGKNCHIRTASDISEYIESENKLKDKFEEEKTLIQCIETLHSGKSPDESISTLLKIINSYYDADIVSIYEISEDRKFLRNTHEFSTHRVPYIPLEQKRTIPFGNFDFALNSIIKKGYYYMPDISDLDINAAKNFRHLALQRKVNSLLCVPVLSQDKSIIGLLYIGNPRRNEDRVKLLLSIISFIKDFLDKNKLMNKLLQLSYLDDLTSIRNRHSYNEELERLKNSESHFLGIAFITLNGLKVVNETRGQKYGDQIIIHLSQKLTQIFSDNVFRIGGDEFVVLDKFVTKEEFSEKINSFLALVKDHETISTSIGHLWSSTSKNVDKLIETSGGLMYIQKQAYYESNTGLRKYKNALAINLYTEIENNQFELYFQPQVSFKTKKFTGVETLIRKFDTDGKMVSPLSFIPFYEREGIIPILDLFVFQKACETINNWNKEGYSQDFTVSINISRETLKEKYLIADLLLTLEEFNVDISRVIIELTETVDGLEQAALARIIKDFQQAGFSVAIDDFGSGHSNFSVLANVECREVKIDKSLVDNLLDTKTQMLIKHMIQIFEEMNINYAVAEGVETKEQFEILKQLNCTTAQGYFIDKPLPEAELLKKYLKRDE